MKYYFEFKDSEECFGRDHFVELMRIYGEMQIKVYPAKMVRGESVFWCSKFYESGSSGEGCGKLCEGYSPRNRKNGRCRFHKNCYEPGDESVTLKLNESRKASHIN